MNMSSITHQKNDSVIRQKGMRLLLDNLGKVDTERFISMIIREPFDYTKWQESLFEDVSFEELGELAMKHYDPM